MQPTLRPEERAALRREVARQAWPVVLQMLLKTMMFYVDSAMISPLGPEALADAHLVAIGRCRCCLAALR